MLLFPLLLDYIGISKIDLSVDNKCRPCYTVIKFLFARGEAMLEIMLVSPYLEQKDAFSSLCAKVLNEPVDLVHFSRGADALRYLESHMPDLVFSADNLPDMDGVRLISQQRIKYSDCIFTLILPRDDPDSVRLRHALSRGVENSVFFPFQDAELLQILLCASEKKQSSESVELQLAKQIRSLRNSFMDRFIESDAFAYAAIDVMNKQYNINFANGIFQVAIIGFNAPLDYDRSILDNIVEDVRLLLDPLCFEMIPFVHKNRSIVLVTNYATSTNINTQLKELRNIVLKNQKRHNCSHTFSIGLGTPEHESMYLKRAFQSAEYALRCQLLLGPNQVHMYSEFKFNISSMDQPELKDYLRELTTRIESMDAKGVSYTIYKVMSILTSATDPAFISELCNTIGMIVISTLNKTTFLPDSQDKMAEIHHFLNTEYSLISLKRHIVTWAEDLVALCKEQKLQEKSRVVYEAQQYIDQNFSHRLTLQSVASKVGLSPTYFCSLFQKEVGYSFIDYLTHLRIEEAKKLLLKTNLSISEISEKVGYSTPRYFSRIFMKTVEMQPSSYRSLHKGGKQTER